MPNDPIISGLSPNPRSFQAAFARVRPLLYGLSERELSSINLDITTSFTTVLGHLAALMSLRPEIASAVPGFDLRRVVTHHEAAGKQSLLNGPHCSSHSFIVGRKKSGRGDEQQTAVEPLRAVRLHEAAEHRVVPIAADVLMDFSTDFPPFLGRAVEAVYQSIAAGLRLSVATQGIFDILVAVLVARGLLGADDASAFSADPDIQMALEAGLGLAIAATAEWWHLLARRFGWEH